MKTNRRQSHLKEDDADPLSVVVNLFDVAMVFAVALMVSMVMNLNMQDFFSGEDFTIVKKKGDDMEILRRDGTRGYPRCLIASEKRKTFGRNVRDRKW